MAKQDAVTHLLTHAVETVIEPEHLTQRLRAGERLRVKHGIDPTGPKIHLGRAVVLWKLREFQDLGHQVVLIVGDYTAQIGDPSDKTQRRVPLTKDQIAENLKGYLDQIAKIIDIAKAEVRHNSEWLGALDGEHLVELAREFTVSQMLARRNFRERFDDSREIGLDEFLYPLFQGYDSVAVKADVEIGGSDQLFNLTAGRRIQEHYGEPAQDILTTNMLTGLDGRKMSTSWGNVVNIADAPQEQFGKLMRTADDLILQYAELAAGFSPDEAAALPKQPPRDAKARVAEAIVARYHGNGAAAAAREEFDLVFRVGQFPSDAPTIPLPPLEYELADYLVATGMASSKSEARRLIKQGAVEVDEKVERDPLLVIEPRDDRVKLRVGKHRFFLVYYPDYDSKDRP